jgi:hypothetical protein
MAVYQGARRPAVTLPRDGGAPMPRRNAVPVRRRAVKTDGRGPLPVIGRPLVGRPGVTDRRRPARKVRAHRRASPVLVTLALIITAFVLGLMYLTQSIRVAATGFEIDRLSSEHVRLQQQLVSLESTITQNGSEPAVLERAGQAGLDRLGGLIRLPAR